MRFLQGEIYHVYNRGNNKQQIFFTRSNYLYFIGKMRQSLAGNCDILAYCLMPNHFHLLLRPNDQGCGLAKGGGLVTTTQQVLSRKIATIQSSYTQALQKQESFKGSLFQQKSKAKQLDLMATVGPNHLAICLHYIHQNPLKAKLVNRMEEWEYSSFLDFAGLRNGTLCNLDLAFSLVDINRGTFIADSYGIVKQELIDGIMYGILVRKDLA